MCQNKPPVCQCNFLPPATKLGQGYVFTGVCDSVQGEWGVPDQVHPPGPARYTPLGPARYTPGTRYTSPRPGTPPVTRYTPWDQVHTPPDQVHPPGPGTPPRTRYSSLDQVHPPGTRLDQVPPRRRACWEIRSTRGRYASYWNAILLKCVFLAKINVSAQYNRKPRAVEFQKFMSYDHV